MHSNCTNGTFHTFSFSSLTPVPVGAAVNFTMDGKGKENFTIGGIVVKTDGVFQLVGPYVVVPAKKEAIQRRTKTVKSTTVLTTNVKTTSVKTTVSTKSTKTHTKTPKPTKTPAKPAKSTIVYSSAVPVATSVMSSAAVTKVKSTIKSTIVKSTTVKSTTVKSSKAKPVKTSVVSSKPKSTSA
jgi:hypothetical protein